MYKNFFWKSNQKLEKGEQPFLRLTNRLYLIHFPIKLHEDIMNSELWGVQECKLHKISIKHNQRTIN